MARLPSLQPWQSASRIVHGASLLILSLYFTLKDVYLIPTYLIRLYEQSWCSHYMDTVTVFVPVLPMQPGDGHNGQDVEERGKNYNLVGEHCADQVVIYCVCVDGCRCRIVDTVFVVHSLWRDAKTISRDFHFYFAINS